MLEAKEYTYTTLDEQITGYKICVKKSFFDRVTNTKNIHRLWDFTQMDLLLVKAIIPARATVYTSSGFIFSKCRSNRAFIDSIYTIDAETYGSAVKCSPERAYKGYAYSIHFTSLVRTQVRFNLSDCIHTKKDYVNFLENTRDIRSRYKKGDMISIINYFNKTPIELLDEKRKQDKSDPIHLKMISTISTPETKFLSFLKAVDRCECASGFHFYKTEQEALCTASNLLKTGGF